MRKRHLLSPFGLFLCGFFLASCHATKVAYHSTEPEPNDIPPSSRFAVILAALQDELPKHPGQRSFYLCVGPETLKALSMRLPDYELHPAAETYTEKDPDWPVEFVRSYRGDHPAVRVHVQFESVTDSEIQITLFVVATYPNVQVVRYTFCKRGAEWLLSHRERPEAPRI